ncbi:MAG TPA: AmmeMemoRadiSam system protein B [Abditibacteriaceae bacterium]
MEFSTDETARPRLRYLEIQPLEMRGEEFWHFHDRQGFAADVVLPRALGPLLHLFDGTRTATQIIDDYENAGGERLPDWFITQLVADMDEKLLLDSPHFAAHRAAAFAEFETSSVRLAAFAGLSYPDEPAKLSRWLDELSAQARERVPELKPEHENSVVLSPEKLRGCVVPHIDFTRGGLVEALAYEPLRDAQFDVLVVLGIAHSGVRYPFCLAPKDYETPLGTALCDREFCAALSERIGDKLTAEQYTHKSEHSIEFVAVFLQHLQNLRSTRIVPILCGGFHEEIQQGTSPSDNAEVRTFCDALRETVNQWEAQGQRVGFVVSVDLAHIGTQFGDATPLTPEILAAIEADDLEFLSHAERGDKDALHEHIARDANLRNVDAHPALYTLFETLPQTRAQLLQYAQAYNAESNIVVSFAAMTLFEA